MSFWLQDGRRRPPQRQGKKRESVYSGSTDRSFPFWTINVLSARGLWFFPPWSSFSSISWLLPRIFARRRSRGQIFNLCRNVFIGQQSTWSFGNSRRCVFYWVKYTMINPWEFFREIECSVLGGAISGHGFLYVLVNHDRERFQCYRDLWRSVSKRLSVFDTSLH